MGTTVLTAWPNSRARPLKKLLFLWRFTLLILLKIEKARRSSWKAQIELWDNQKEPLQFYVCNLLNFDINRWLIGLQKIIPKSIIPLQVHISKSLSFVPDFQFSIDITVKIKLCNSIFYWVLYLHFIFFLL